MRIKRSYDSWLFVWNTYVYVTCCLQEAVYDENLGGSDVLLNFEKENAMGMAKLLVCAVVALLANSGFAATLYWKNPGADPCNPKVGCTIEWALGNAGLPVEVREAFPKMVKSENSKPYTVESGWRGWMTWGKNSPKFEPDTVAAWSKDHTEPARLWTYDYKGLRYNLVRVTKCGNWGGWTEGIKDKVQIESKPLAQSANLMPLGVLPIVACPE